jgi:hypothetical protein
MAGAQYDRHGQKHLESASWSRHPRDFLRLTPRGQALRLAPQDRHFDALSLSRYGHSNTPKSGVSVTPALRDRSCLLTMTALKTTALELRGSFFRSILGKWIAGLICAML